MSKRQRVLKHNRKMVEISGSKYVNIPTVFFDRPCPRFLPMRVIVDTQGGCAEVELDGNERKKNKKNIGIRKKTAR